MKKILSVILTATLILSFCSCAGNTENTGDDGKKLNIVTTVFPVYDWVRNILGENEDVKLTMLLDSGVDLHSFQPTADDIMEISACDLFIYVGGESDEWVEDALKQSQNDDLKAVSLMDELGESVKEEELKDGMEAEAQEGGAPEEKEYDEHIWLSLKNARLLCEKICRVITEKDKENENTYSENLKSYCDKLSLLDTEYQNAVNAGTKKTLLFADRFPFRYLTDDYGLDYFAAFKGCSAESEASFETVTFLAKKVDELNLNCVLQIDGTQNNIAKTVVESTKSKNQKILSVNSMQSVTSGDVENGADYYNIMEKNLSVFKEALV